MNLESSFLFDLPGGRSGKRTSIIEHASRYLDELQTPNRYSWLHGKDDIFFRIITDIFRLENQEYSNTTTSQE